MSNVLVRDIPAEIMERIREAAARQRRSINAQMLVYLAEGVRTEEQRAAVRDLLDAARRIRSASKRRRGTDSVTLIRRGREERGR